MRRWRELPGLGWYRPGDMFVYRGDFRLHLHHVHRSVCGYDQGRHRNLYRYEVSFTKAGVIGCSAHSWFLVACLLAIIDTHRLLWRKP